MNRTFSRRRFCATLLSLSVYAAPAFAQKAQALPPVRFLDEIRWNAATDPPLLWVTDIGEFAAPRNAEEREQIRSSFAKQTVRQFAEGGGLRVFVLDGMSAIAPRNRTVIANVPAKPANPIANLNPQERFSVLLSLLTRPQWEAATGAAGIGVGDLTDEQRPVYLGLLPPDKIIVQKNRTIPDDTGLRYEPDGDPQEFAPQSARLRLVRRVEFGFRKTGEEDLAFSSDINQQLSEPDTAYTGNFDGARRNDDSSPRAFGAAIFRTEPNGQKTGALSFDLPALGVAVPLLPAPETVELLLKRVGKITGTRLLCDRRVAALKVYRRVPPTGANVSASAILQGLCLGVCGTFRKLDAKNSAPVYLLTNDVEGIASRFLRWSDWAENALYERSKMLDGAAGKAAANDPLSLIGFAPNDPYALPPALLAGVDKAYRAERYGSPPWIKTTVLPPVLQNEVKNVLSRWLGEVNGALDTGTVQVRTELTCQLLLPGGLAVEPSGYGRNGGQMLQKIAVTDKPDLPTGVVVPAKPPILPTGAGRRVLLVPTAPDTDTAEKWLRVAKRKGFGDVWFHTMLTQDAAETARLQATITAGTKIGIGVGAVVDVLRGYSGEPDINLLGETGAAFAKRKKASPAASDSIVYQYPGWNVWDETAIEKGLRPIAKCSGLSALVLRATAAPGHAGVVHGGDGIPPGGHLGYTPAERLTCLTERGYDPVDIAEYSYTLSALPNLPFFRSSEELYDDMTTFHFERNKRNMARLWAFLAGVAPKTALFLNDRASSYAYTNSSWFVRWMAAGKIPVCPLYAGKGEHRTAAFAVSPEPLLNGFAWGDTPADRARHIVQTAQGAKRWRGFTIDASYHKPTEILPILNALADAPGAKPITPPSRRRAQGSPR